MNPQQPVLDSAQRRNGRRKLFAFGAVVCSLSAVGIVVSSLWYSDALSRAGDPLVSAGAIAFMVCVILGLAFTHLWSVNLLALLYDRVLADREQLRRLEASTGEDPEDPRKQALRESLGNRPCGYCGAARAPIVCAECGSVQWSDLMRLEWRTVLGDEGDCRRGPRHWALAAFFAHNRFKIAGAVLSVAIVGTLSFLVQAHHQSSLRESDQRVRHVESARVVVEAIVTARSSALLLATYCGEIGRGQATAENQCRESRELLLRGFYMASWKTPLVLEDLYARACQPEGHATRYSTPVAAACRAIREERHHSLIDDFDGCFRRLYRAAVCGPGSAFLAAADFYDAGKRLGCLLEALSFGAADDLRSSNAEVIWHAAHPFFGCEEALGQLSESTRRCRDEDPLLPVGEAEQNVGICPDGMSSGHSATAVDSIGTAGTLSNVAQASTGKKHPAPSRRAQRAALSSRQNATR